MNRKKSLKSRKNRLREGGGLKGLFKPKPVKVNMSKRPLPNPHVEYKPQGPIEPYTKYGAPKPSKIEFSLSKLGFSRPNVNLYTKAKKNTMTSRGIEEIHARRVRLNELEQRKLIKAKVKAPPNQKDDKEVQQVAQFNTIRLLTAKARQTYPENYKTVPRVIAEKSNVENHSKFYTENKQRQSFADNKLRESFAENASKHALTKLSKLGGTQFSTIKDLTANNSEKYNSHRNSFFTDKIAEIEKSRLITPTPLSQEPQKSVTVPKPVQTPELEKTQTQQVLPENWNKMQTPIESPYSNLASITSNTSKNSKIISQFVSSLPVPVQVNSGTKANAVSQKNPKQTQNANKAKLNQNSNNLLISLSQTSSTGNPQFEKLLTKDNNGNTMLENIIKINKQKLSPGEKAKAIKAVITTNNGTQSFFKPELTNQLIEHFSVASSNRIIAIFSQLLNYKKKNQSSI